MIRLLENEALEFRNFSCLRKEEPREYEDIIQRKEEEIKIR